MDSPSRKALAALFFIFGFGIVSWVPRIPEIKSNLELNNGQFGTVISLGAIGSILSLLVTGHLVHRFGTRRMLLVSATLLFGSIALVPHMSSVWKFLIVWVIFGASASAFNIAVNAQTFHEQESDGIQLVPRMHGTWSAGALSTVILSGFLAGRVPLATHLDVLAAVAYVATLIIVERFKTFFMPGSGQPIGTFSVRSPFSSFQVNWIILMGLAGATGLEFAIGDWISLLNRQELHMGVGISTIPYILFVVAMITGRLSVHRLARKYPLDLLVRVVPLIGGATFMVTVNLGVLVGKHHTMSGFYIVALGTFIAGLGLSFLAPTFVDAANRLTETPGGIVLGQLSLVNTFVIFFVKMVIAWTAQITSIPIALIIPSTLLIAASFTARTIKRAHA